MIAAAIAVLALVLASVLSGGQHPVAPRHPVGPSGPTPRAPAPPPKIGPAIGVSLNTVFNTPGLSDRAVASQVAAARAAGVRLARADALWEASEPAPPRGGIHGYDWRFDDRIASRLAEQGISWLPIVDYAPAWAASAPSAMHSAPRSDADYAAYAGALARRYGPAGDFWRGQPRLAYLPVTTYELWNEENTSLFWGPAGPDPGRYADLYLQARAAIRRVDPHAKAVVGGLGEPATSFVSTMLAARPALRGAIDGVAVHPYAKTPPEVFVHVRELRQQLDGLNESGVPIYVTEIGWATSPPTSVKYAPPRVKAANIVTTLSTLDRSDCNIAAVILYTWSSPEANPADDNDWFGIYHPGGQTPSSLALARFLHARAARPTNATIRICHP